MNTRHYVLPILLATTVGILHAQQQPPASSASRTNSAVEKPLPDVASLFHDVEAHQKELENVRKNYMFRAVEQQDELDGDGHVKHSKTEEHEVFFVGRRTVGRLLRKDGVDLSASEQKKEQEKVDKRIQEIKKKEAKRQQNEEEGKHDENEITVDTLLRISRFENPRRVSLKDRSAIAYDFSGNPDAKTHGMAESAVKKVSGTVWIDEDSRQLIRMEAKLDEPFKVGGGLLASVQKGSSFVFEQAFVNGEIWLPTYAEANITGRMLLFKGIREHSIARFSDYRKFRVGSKIDVVGEVAPQ
ncbi:MAG: hypothetical protein JWN45_1796 [Acidobacteriaceae bacterium]|nr:hypothetical protein [Acidobacteriaceae bacterium]